jgi:hypothetical protein
VTGYFVHLADHRNLNGILRNVSCRSVDKALDRLGNRVAFV